MLLELNKVHCQKKVSLQLIQDFCFLSPVHLSYSTSMFENNSIILNLLGIS